jgi:hypothetical protein
MSSEFTEKLATFRMDLPVTRSTRDLAREFQKLNTAIKSCQACSAELSKKNLPVDSLRGGNIS